MDPNAEFDSGAEVTLPDDAKDAKRIEISPELIQQAMMSGQLPGGHTIKNKRGITKPIVSRAVRKQKRKAQKAARKASRGTTTSIRGQSPRMNHTVNR